MEYTVDRHYAADKFLQDRIREPPDERSAVVFVNHRVDLGSATYCVDARIHTAEKVFSQAHPLFLVPRIGLRDILFRLDSDNEFSGHADYGPSVEPLPR